MEGILGAFNCGVLLLRGLSVSTAIYLLLTGFRVVGVVGCLTSKIWVYWDLQLSVIGMAFRVLLRGLPLLGSRIDGKIEL